MLVDDIKRRRMAALKAGNALEKEILGVALGEIETRKASDAQKGVEDKGDEVALAIVRKLVKSNEETLAVASDAAQKDALAKELEILRSLLPQTLGVPQIVEALAPVREQIRAASNDGQATGVAMKHLKSLGAGVAGKDVSEAVKQLRA
jgi:uncharacterized protein YqeY